MSLYAAIVVESEGETSVQADRNDGTSLVAAIVEENSVTGRTHGSPSDGPMLHINANHSGWVERGNLREGVPCALVAWASTAVSKVKSQFCRQAS